VRTALARNLNAQLSKGAGRVGCAIRITVRTCDSRRRTNDAATLGKTACLAESCLLHSGLGGQYLRHDNIEAYVVSGFCCFFGGVILDCADWQRGTRCITFARQAISRAEQRSTSTIAVAAMMRCCSTEAVVAQSSLADGAGSSVDSQQLQATVTRSGGAHTRMDNNAASCTGGC